VEIAPQIYKVAKFAENAFPQSALDQCCIA